MIKLEFKPSESELCLFSKKANGSMIFFVVYVDGCYVIGSDVNLKAFISNIQMNFRSRSKRTQPIIFLVIYVLILKKGLDGLDSHT
jgi:hypothetical protein